MDILVAEHSSIYILTGVTDAGREWLKEHLPEETPRWGGGYVIEHRYVQHIIDGAQADGMEVAP